MLFFIEMQFLQLKINLILKLTCDVMNWEWYLCNHLIVLDKVIVIRGLQRDF
jgi:hypothetical protein